MNTLYHPLEHRVPSIGNQTEMFPEKEHVCVYTNTHAYVTTQLWKSESKPTVQFSHDSTIDIQSHIQKL